MENDVLKIIFKDCFDYEGASLTKSLYENNFEFKRLIDFGFEHGLIKGFDNDLFAQMDELNMRGKGVLSDAFKVGANIGACTSASKLVSFIFYRCNIAGGTNRFLIGTKNSKGGSHTWVVGSDNKIYDTTFMLIIDSNYALNMGYTLERIDNPNIDQFYSSAKEFALDKNIRSKEYNR